MIESRTAIRAEASARAAGLEPVNQDIRNRLDVLLERHDQSSRATASVGVGPSLQSSNDTDSESASEGGEPLPEVTVQTRVVAVEGGGLCRSGLWESTHRHRPSSDLKVSY